MLLSNVDFGSFLTYTPRGTTDLMKKSKNIMYYLKSEKHIGNPPRVMSEFVTEKIVEEMDRLPFKGFFGEEVSLVPVPKSSPMKSDTLWVPDRIVKSMVNHNLGKYFPCLERITKVNKASYSISSERPKSIDHYNSIKVKSILHKPEKIVLVDDVITRGATLLGCASKLKETYPNISIQGFAILRTISNPDDFIAIEQPCIGQITLFGDDTFRSP